MLIYAEVIDMQRLSLMPATFNNKDEDDVRILQAKIKLAGVPQSKEVC